MSHHYSPYKLFTSVLWLAEQHVQSRDFYALGVTVHVLAELAHEEFIGRKLAHDKGLEARWDLVWHSHLRGADSRVPPPVKLVESLLDGTEAYLEAGDWVSARAVVPKLALLESVHGVERVFPGELAGRVDAVRFALKDHRG